MNFQFTNRIINEERKESNIPRVKSFFIKNYTYQFINYLRECSKKKIVNKKYYHLFFKFQYFIVGSQFICFTTT